MAIGTDINVAVLGADSLAGQKLLELLEGDTLPVGEVAITSVGEEESTLFKGRGIAYSAAMQLQYADYDVVFCTAAGVLNPELLALIQESGSFFLDSSGESTGELAIAGLTKQLDQGIAHWSLPDSRVALLAPILSALKDHELVSVDAVFLEPASMAGDAGVAELAGQAAKLLNGRPPEPSIFPAQIAFNMIANPASNASLVTELQRLCEGDLPAMPSISIRSVQVGVFYGLGLSLGLHFKEPTEAAVIDGLIPGKPAKVADAVALSKGKGWMRDVVEQQNEHQLSMWIASDDIRARAEGLINLAKLLIKS